jgi:hypothetical protein
MGLWFFDGWFFVFSGIVPGNFSAINDHHPDTEGNVLLHRSTSKAL